MSFSANIHPRKKWVAIDVRFLGERKGSCVQIVLIDEIGNSNDLALHYGDKENARDFVSMLKGKIGELPDGKEE